MQSSGSRCCAGYGIKWEVKGYTVGAIIPARQPGFTLSERRVNGNRGWKKPRTRTHKAPSEAVKLEKMGYCCCYCHCYGERRAGTRRRRGSYEWRRVCTDESSGPCETKPWTESKQFHIRRFLPAWRPRILVSFARIWGDDRRSCGALWFRFISLREFPCYLKFSVPWKYPPDDPFSPLWFS